MLQTTSVNMSETNRTFLGRRKPQVLIKSEERTMKNMIIYRKLKKKDPSSEQKTVTATKHNCWNNSQKRESSAVGRGPWDSSLLVQTASIQHSLVVYEVFKAVERYRSSPADTAFLNLSIRDPQHYEYSPSGSFDSYHYLICQSALKSTTVIQLKSMLQYKKQPYWNQYIFWDKMSLSKTSVMWRMWVYVPAKLRDAKV